MIGHNSESEILLRCRTAVDTALGGRVADVDLDATAADVRRVATSDPVIAAALAADLVRALVLTDVHGGPENLRHLDGLLEIAESHPPDTAQWPEVRAIARRFALMRAAAELEIADPDAALAHLEALAGDSDGPAARLVHDLTRIALAHVRDVGDGSGMSGQRLRADTEQMRRLGAAHPAMAPIADVLDALTRAAAANERGDPTELSSAMDAFTRSAQGLPPGSYLRGVVDRTVEMMTTVAGLAQNVAPTEARLAGLRGLAERADIGEVERAMIHASLAGTLLGGGHETDPGRVDEGVEQARLAVASAPPGNPRRVFALFTLALALVRRNELTLDLADLVEAEQVLNEARDTAGGAHDPTWQPVNEMLAHVQRRRGTGDSPHQTALDGLRGNMWKVLLEPDPTTAARAAREAARDARDIAQMCLVDGDPGAAVRALDAGRGLILYAASQLRDAAGLLVDSGRAELARRWREATAAGPVPYELRREVVTVLARDSAVASRLLDPPDLPQIRRALSTLEAEALVYLVPGQSPTTGWAVIVPAEGPPALLALPNLLMDDDLDIEQYFLDLAERDVAPTAPDGPRDLSPPNTDARFARSLDAVCDWAWRAAIGPLVEQYLAVRPGPRSGRVPHVVLVPIGPLARVPWPAARRADGTYAVNLVGFSQAASARMLCDSAERPAVPLGPLGLVVGDPDTRADASAAAEVDLVAARTEAYAIHQAFYRGGRYVGRRPDGSPSRSGSGTVDDVRDWLSTTRPGAGAMLHLACHGVIRADREASTSYLALAGGGRLTAEELIDLMAASPVRAVGLVVLAACRTGMSIHGYDEAYSLGTAFLAGGARSVLSTHWRIPDRATSVLMFMFHHFLNAEGRPAWDALRHAQLWMLDPDRRPPSTMPVALRRHLDHTEPSGVVAWAGFVHGGQ